MIRTTLATIAVLIVGGIAATQMGGREGMGVVAGLLCGTSVSALGSMWQRHNFTHRPKRAFNSVIETFLFKMAFVMLGALSFRYIEAAASRADWRAFLLSFVATAFVIQTVSVIENVALLRASSTHPGAPRPSVGEPALATNQAKSPLA